MIVQTVVDDLSLIYWDQATQLKQYRLTRQEFTDKWYGDDQSPLVSRYASYKIIEEVRGNSDKPVRCVHWVDRSTDQNYILFSQQNVYILNDEGKTLFRV